jgi:uncharacterized protein (DUF2235 family)
MAKNIVVCLDGTGNQLKARGNTNVLRVFELLDLSDPARQVGYYDPGVGTFSATGALTPWGKRLSRLTGLAFGTGLRTNLSEAYTYLMRTYEAGDRLFIFGFSRGAYTARALAGFLKAVGLLRPGAENLVPYAVSVYTRNSDYGQDDWKQLHHFAGSLSRKVDGYTGIRVEYLGLWDTVKAAGFLRFGDLRWPYTRKLPNVARIRHAVSIDERRRPYREYLVTPPDGEKGPVLEEVWFAGVHSDVGGTFDDDPRLPAISLKWVLDGAVEAGLVVKPKAYRDACALAAEHAQGTVHQMGRIWGALGYRARVVPPTANCHDSVRVRVAADPAYAAKVPDTVTWVDADWLKRR